MKALELADSVEKNWSTGYRDQIIAELRRLAAVEADCAPYLKEGETPAERIKRALGDADSLMSLYRDVVAERDALKAENERLTNCLKKANDQAEDFERRWYLADMELERIKALPPVAWEVYVADADNAYVVESLDDPQLIDDCTNSDAVVTPLIALGSKTA